eukprot:8254696-Pyramimonas_sp.AAC.1
MDPMAWLNAVCSGTSPLCTSSRSLVECLAMIFCWLAAMRATHYRPCPSSRPRTRPAAAAPLTRVGREALPPSSPLRACGVAPPPARPAPPRACC